MTLRGTVQVNSEAIGATVLPFRKTVRSSCYTFLRKKKTTTTKNYFRAGHEKQEFVCFSKSTPFYDTEQT